MVCEWKGNTENRLVHVVYSVAMYVNYPAILDAVALSVGRKARMCIQAEDDHFRITVERTVHCKNLVKKIA
jgi:hypothetical protein